MFILLVVKVSYQRHAGFVTLSSRIRTPSLFLQRLSGCLLPSPSLMLSIRSEVLSRILQSSPKSGKFYTDNPRYANKLIPEKGLALSVFDILTAEDGKVTWGNGMMYYKGQLLSSLGMMRLIS